MVPTLEISPDFTIEDIHRVRENNYEATKHMTVEEKLHYYNTPRTDAEEQIGRLRVKRKEAKSIERNEDIKKARNALMEILSMKKRLPDDFDPGKELEEARAEKYKVL